MPITKTEICNEALSQLGEDFVNDVTNEDEGQNAVWANRLYPQVKREVLRSHKWKCAYKLVELAETSTDPEFGYENSYQLPSDFVRLVSINDDDPDYVSKPLYRRVGNEIHTDESECKILYVHDAEEHLLDPLLIKSIAMLLASKLAFPLQQDKEVRDDMYKKYRMALLEAKTVDSTESREAIPSHRADSKWIQSRYSSTNG